MTIWLEKNHSCRTCFGTGQIATGYAGSRWCVACAGTGGEITELVENRTVSLTTPLCPVEESLTIVAPHATFVT